MSLTADASQLCDRRRATAAQRKRVAILKALQKFCAARAPTPPTRSPDVPAASRPDSSGSFAAPCLRLNDGCKPPAQRLNLLACRQFSCKVQVLKKWRDACEKRGSSSARSLPFRLTAAQRREGVSRGDPLEGFAVFAQQRRFLSWQKFSLQRVSDARGPARLVGRGFSRALFSTSSQESLWPTRRRGACRA